MKLFPPSQEFPGRPTFFDPDVYLDAVEMMINADEVNRAFWMLDNMPAYYRDNVPSRAATMRVQLNEVLFTPVQYKGVYDTLSIDGEAAIANWPSRATIVEEEIIKLNAKTIKPNIMELAPGQFWLPAGLKYKGLDFTYEHLSLDNFDHPFDKPWPSCAFNIFIAFELIEHLHCENEIYQNYLKFKRTADMIMLSTPLYTFAGGMDKWQTRQLGHLRTYTPKEFVDKAAGMFPGYEWGVYVDHVITLVGSIK